MVVQGVVRCRTFYLFRRLSYLRISTSRICVLQHFAFRPDQLIEIPYASIRSTRLVNGSWIRLDVSCETGSIALYLKPWEKRLRRIVVEPVLKMSAVDLCNLLSP